MSKLIVPNESKGLNCYEIEAEKVYFELKEREAYYKKEKPFYLRTKRWFNFSHLYIQRLNELRELSDALKRDNVPSWNGYDITQNKINRLAEQ